ncbi:MAG: PEGA domain-containing protein [Parachlamydia sp.]|jgi:hypothetical protein|nr:PEGA domain-containing protein [Parachlamydia sp.]
MMIFSIFLTSCCSILTERSREVMVTAQQQDTEVTIDGYACGTAPLLVELDKRFDHMIMVSKLGYQPSQVCLKSRHTARWASNLLIPFPEIKIINLTCDHLHL